MSKVTVVGAGNVGATCANVLAFNEVADEVVMLDVKEGVSEGKAMDMMQTAQLLGFDTVITGCTNDYEKTANSDVVVITSGIPRKPGMTREELIGVNAGIVKSVAQNILKYSPNAILVVISNPMDTMTYLALKSLGLPKNRIIGMGGALDSSRFKYFLSQALGCNANEVEGMVIGSHGDTTMIPLARLATYKGQPVSTLLSEEKLNEVVAATMVGGATLTKLLGTSGRRVWRERHLHRRTCNSGQERHREDCRAGADRRRESQICRQCRRRPQDECRLEGSGSALIGLF